MACGMRIARLILLRFTLLDQGKRMKKLGVALIVMLASLSAFAGDCTTTTLDNYLGSGFSCGIDDKTFSTFSYLSSSNPGGFAIPANGVEVSPITSPGNPGFLFNAPWQVSNNSGILAQDSLIGYTVMVNSGGNAITDLTLAMVGFDAIGTGEITIDETYCLGGLLPTCSGGTEGTLVLNWTSSGGTSSKTIDFAGVTEVSVEKDILLSAGTDGQAAVSGVYNQFSEGTVPEPGTLTMFGIGAVGVAAYMRRKMKA
jgi:PEP-CTERM motif